MRSAVKRMASTPDKFVWIDGELTPWDQATVHISHLGWSTVAAVFDSINAYWNAQHRQLYALQLTEHLHRLLQSMKIMRLQTDLALEDLAEGALDLLRANGYRKDCRVRPVAYQPDADWFGTWTESRTSIFMTTAARKSWLGRQVGLRAGVSSWTRISDNSLSPRVKGISNYQNSRLALLEANLRGYDQPILLNAAGKVAESATACVFIVRDGRLITPSVTSGILESITRRSVIRLATELLNLPVQEREVDRTEMYIAEEMFLCGTNAEIRPIISIDDYQVGDGVAGPVTQRLTGLLNDLVRGNDSRFPEWRRPVYA